MRINHKGITVANVQGLILRGSFLVAEDTVTWQFDFEFNIRSHLPQLFGVLPTSCNKLGTNWRYGFSQGGCLDVSKFSFLYGLGLLSELAIDDPAAVVTVKPATKQTVKNIANEVVAKELEAKKVSLLDFEN
ncbi:hypothetical protein Tco_1027582 [Tanacetum coccineum]